MVVAIGIIIKPISLKKYKLMKIFNKTDTKETQKGLLVSWFAKKKLEKTFIIAKAGKPKLKK